MKNIHAQQLGKLGGHATASKMTPEQRLERSRKANEAKRRKMDNFNNLNKI